MATQTQMTTPTIATMIICVISAVACLLPLRGNLVEVTVEVGDGKDSVADGGKVIEVVVLTKRCVALSVDVGDLAVELGDDVLVVLGEELDIGTLPVVVGDRDEVVVVEWVLDVVEYVDADFHVRELSANVEDIVVLGVGNGEDIVVDVGDDVVVDAGDGEVVVLDGKGDEVTAL